ncbi:hypothetical protein ACFL7M_07935 [Thermodesulfobacteriota bacterium]
MKKERESVPEPRRASTLILTRHADEELQVYLIRRSVKSAFMPENYVFPGGTVDPEDWGLEFWGAYIDLDRDEITQRLGVTITDEEIAAYSIAAIRETFEEAGVLLIQQSYHSSVNLGELNDRRMTNSLLSGWFREWIEGKKQILAFSGLGRWSHWITPKARSHRYDARFFMAFMPSFQECIPDSRETTHGIWISPEEGLLGNLKGQIPLSPPALVTLNELFRYKNVEDLKIELETREWGKPRLPILQSYPNGLLLLLQSDPLYGNKVEIDPEALANEAAIAPGEPFSRLWCRDGIWLPIAC